MKLDFHPIAVNGSDLAARVDIGGAVLHFLLIWNDEREVWIATHDRSELAVGMIGEVVDACEWYAGEMAKACDVEECDE